MNNIHSLMATVDGKHTAFTLQDHMDFAEKFGSVRNFVSVPIS